jgi:hypothetical protein
MTTTRVPIACVGLDKGPSELRRRSEHRKEGPGDVGALEPLGIAVAGEIERRRADRGGIVEHTALLGRIAEIRRRERRAEPSATAVEQDHQAIGIAIR